MSALLRKIMLNHNGDFYFLNCLHSFRTKKNLNHIKKYVKIKAFSHVTMPFEVKLLLQSTNHLKAIKASFLIYADLKFLIKK